MSFMRRLISWWPPQKRTMTPWAALTIQLFILQLKKTDIQKPNGHGCGQPIWMTLFGQSWLDQMIFRSSFNLNHLVISKSELMKPLHKWNSKTSVWYVWTLIDKCFMAFPNSLAVNLPCAISLQLTISFAYLNRHTVSLHASL